MYRLVVITGIALGAACGSATDDRPRTLEYVSQTILAPHCANAVCHSAFRHAGVPGTTGYAFDTVETSNASIQCGGLVAPNDVEGSFLVTVMTRRGGPPISGGSQNARMPYDEPLPDPDIDLIKDWIATGAVGLVDVTCAN